MIEFFEKPHSLATPVLNGDIFDQVVIIFIQKEPGSHIDHHFTDETFESDRFE